MVAHTIAYVRFPPIADISASVRFRPIADIGPDAGLWAGVLSTELAVGE